MDPQANPFDQFDSHPPAGMMVIPGAPDPTLDLKRPKAQADLTSTQIDTARTQQEIARTAQLTPAQVRQANAEAEHTAVETALARQKLAKGGDGGGPESAATRAAAIAGYRSAQQLKGIVSSIEQLNAAGPGATHGLAGLQDYLPTTANLRLNNAGDAARGVVGSALGFTGGQLNTETEAEHAVGPYLPNSWDRDEVRADKIARLRGLAASAEQRAIQQLNGVPDANGNIHPLPVAGSVATAGSGGGLPPAPGSPPAPGGPPAMPGGPGTPVIASGATKTVADPRGNAIIDSLLRKNASDDQINAALSAIGVPAMNPSDAASARDYLKRNPGFKGSFGAATREVPTTLGERVGGSAPGAAITGALTGLTGGFDDELVGGINSLAGNDYTKARDAYQQRKGMLGSAYPIATTLGDVAGGIGATLLPASGLAKAGVAAKYALPAVDAGYGALYGAGSNNDNRAAGAAIGAGAGVVGGMFGRGLTKAIGSAIAPTGGALAPLYEQGVFPTIGQRMADKGVIGRAINTGEQALQSLPGVGALITRARNIPRTQFERGAFNQALGEIGDKLPASTELGTPAHAYMQGKFNDAYDATRGAMTFRPDQQYGADVSTWRHGLGSGILNGDQASRVETLVDRAVNSRMGQTGQLSGDAYKAASSELTKAAGKLSATDPAMADAVRDYGSIFDDAARRASGPGPAAALDAVDRGYAKAVRVEQAAAARGGDTGRFTPAQFDRSVQQASGGVRSRAYLRGDALMGDYADAGKGLVDTLPNSGSADRLMAGQVVGTGATGLGGVALGVGTMLKGAPLLAPYVPGINHVVTRAMAPRSSAALNLIGSGVKKQARLGGMFGSRLLLDLSQ